MNYSKNALSKSFLILTTLLLTNTACQKANQEGEVQQASKLNMVGKSSTLIDPKIVGPKVGLVYSDLSYKVELPEGYNLQTITWEFGDGSANQSGSLQAVHLYKSAGNYELKAHLVDTAQNQITVSQYVNTIEYIDGLECIYASDISSPDEAEVGTPVSISLNVGSCFSETVQSVKWSFGDSSPESSQSSPTHTYTATGKYTIQVEVYSSLSQGTAPFLILSRDILIKDPVVEEPVDPLACPTVGETRSSYGEEYAETVSCGTGGTKQNIMRVKTIETCQQQGEVTRWVVTTQTPEVHQEGECQNQSCQLPDGSTLAHNGSKTFYSSQNPNGTCAEVSTTKTCVNGSLQGSQSHTFLSCTEGCTGFGPNGTVKTEVITGEMKSPITCAYGEEGYFNIYHQLSDQKCVAGEIVTSNERQGSIKTPGVCPSYQWKATEEWSSCSADCGGEQTRIYKCVDGNGVSAPLDRCASEAPQEKRVCDGNPEAVKRTESSVTQEEGNSSGVCPKNQIGVIVNIRNVTKLTNYACIDHQVKVESETTEYGPWEQESYCRDYVARRCSQDSLSNTDAKGRFEWMVKCQDQLPIVKEFLASFEDIKASGKFSIDSGSRLLYPTFMDHSKTPEKPWIAPKSKKSACIMPNTAYVAAVCVSSCSTPEQEILAEAKANMKMKYTPFIEALTQNYGFVATPRSHSSITHGAITKTKVDQWVTEMIDTEHEILVFEMKSGRTLKVTTNHPIVADNGSMKLAADFKVGDSLVQLGGILDPIVSIQKVPYFGKVYNLFVKSSDPMHNIVLINGYMNGTAFFQNEGAHHVNRNLLREKLIQKVFAK